MTFTPTILQLLPALGDGGVEKSALEMAGYIDRAGWGSLVASGGGDLVAAVEAAGARHFTVPVGRKNPIAMVANARRIAALIDAEGVDIVHARSRAPAWVGWLACRWFSRRKPVFLTTFHGLYGHGNALKRFYNAAMLRGPRVIANSRFIRDHIVAVYGIDPARIAIAERGIDEAGFDPALYTAADRDRLRAEFAVPPGAALILMVGRLTRWKGQHVAVAALAASDAPDAVCVFAGRAESADYQAELVALGEALGVSGRLRFAGSRRDVAALNAAADIALSCSVQPEAFGRVAIEAMALETPVIATAHGGSLETVVDGVTGLLVPPGDAAALARAIDRLAADPALRREMSVAGRARAISTFTTRATCEKEFAVYRTLLAEAAAGG